LQAVSEVSSLFKECERKLKEVAKAKNEHNDDEVYYVMPF